MSFCCCLNDSPTLYYVGRYRRHVFSIIWSFSYGLIPILDLVSDYWLCVTFLQNEDFLFFSLSLTFLFLGNRLRSLMYFLHDWKYYRLDSRYIYLLSSYFFGYALVECCFSKTVRSLSDLPLALVCDLGLIAAFPLYILILFWSTLTNIHEEANRSIMDKNIHIRFEIFNVVPQCILTIVAFSSGRINFIQFLIPILADALEFCRLWKYYKIPIPKFCLIPYICCCKDRHKGYLYCKYYSLVILECFYICFITLFRQNNLHLVKNSGLNMPCEVRLKGKADSTVTQAITTHWNVELLIDESSDDENSSSEGIPYESENASMWFTLPLSQIKIINGTMIVNGTEEVPTDRQANWLRLMRERRFTTDSSTVGMGCSANTEGILRVYVKDGEKVYASVVPSFPGNSRSLMGFSPNAHSSGFGNYTANTTAEASSDPTGTPQEEKKLFYEGGRYNQSSYYHSSYSSDSPKSYPHQEHKTTRQGLGVSGIPIRTDLTVDDLQHVLPPNHFRRSSLKQTGSGSSDLFSARKKVQFSVGVDKQGEYVLHMDNPNDISDDGSFLGYDEDGYGKDGNGKTNKYAGVGTPLNRYHHMMGALNGETYSHADSESYSNAPYLRDSLATITPRGGPVPFSGYSYEEDPDYWSAPRRKTFDVGYVKGYAADGLVDHITHHDHLFLTGGSHFSLPTGVNLPQKRTNRKAALPRTKTFPLPEASVRSEFTEIHGSLTRDKDVYHYHDDGEEIYDEVYE